MAAKGKTKYVILKSIVGFGAPDRKADTAVWEQLPGQYQAASVQAVIEAAAKATGDDEARFVAIPAGSFRPAKAEVEVETKVKVTFETPGRTRKPKAPAAEAT